MIDLESLIHADALGRWIVGQRWFASKTREPAGFRVLEAAPLDHSPEPQMVLALVEVGFGAGTHELYHLPLGLRHVDEGWEDGVIDTVGDRTVYDATIDPACARRLVEALGRGERITAENAEWSFHHVTDLPSGEDLDPVRPIGVEQSNSSTVFGDELILKVYRRVEPGPNPELELLRFLTEHGFEHIAQLRGWYEHNGRLVDATLGSDPNDPTFMPEEVSAESISLLIATIDEDIDVIFRDLPEVDSVAEIRHRGQEVRDQLRALAHAGQGGRIIRNHGDYHLGQCLLSRRGWVVLDFEGEPARSLPERRHKRSPLRDVAGMLRSFAYAASASEILRAVKAPEDWEQRARDAFLGAYFEHIDNRLLPHGQQSTERLLQIFELEKAVYELRYELNNRPDWVRIPAAGIARLLEAPIE